MRQLGNASELWFLIQNESQSATITEKLFSAYCYFYWIDVSICNTAFYATSARSSIESYYNDKFPLKDHILNWKRIIVISFYLRIFCMWKYSNKCLYLCMKETFVRDREHFLCIICKETNSSLSCNIFPFLHIISFLCTYLKLIFQHMSACRVKLQEQSLHF